MLDPSKDRIDAIADAFEKACRSGPLPRVSTYLDQVPPTERPELLRELVRLDLEYRYRAGEANPVESCLARHPELAGNGLDVLELITLECRLCLLAGQPVTVADYQKRFPHLDAEIAARLAPLVPQVLAVPGYTVGEQLGEGGMGVVYRAVDVEFGRPVALKLVRPDYAQEPSISRRFQDEARITGRLQHPGIPPVHRLGTLPDGRSFLVMKLIEGRTLQMLLAERVAGGDEPARYLHVFEQVCQTMAYAHSQGVIHRDLKPGNIMVGAFGEVQVWTGAWPRHRRPRQNRRWPVRAARQRGHIPTWCLARSHTCLRNRRGLVPSWMPAPTCSRWEQSCASC
jgi:hypothetical protein